MLSLFTKPIAELRCSDVDAFLAEAPPENLFLELKQDLPEKAGGASQWMQGKGRFEDRSRNELAAEIVAFANGDGGTLLLGVIETTAEPKRPAGLNPLPDPATLARRLHDAIVDIIEPPLSAFEAGGVMTENGSGIVIFRVEASSLAPHRLNTGDFQSYVRRDDKKRKMSMREIHDMVLQREFSRSRFERLFLETEERFQASPLIERPSCSHMRWQVMAAPKRSVRVAVGENILVPDADLVFEHPRSEPFHLRSDFQRGYDRSIPILGGVMISGDIYFAEPGSYGHRIKEERYRDGRYLVTMEVTDCKDAQSGRPHPFLGSEWPVLWLLRALNWIVEVRRSAREPVLEFGLQFITDNRQGFRLLALGEADGGGFRHSGSKAKQAQLVSSPIYEIGTGDAMERTANELFTDLFNSFGTPRGNDPSTKLRGTVVTTRGPWV